MATVSYRPTRVRRVAPTVELGVAPLLSLLAAVLAVAVSAAGLHGGLYRDNAWVTADQKGNDVVTLLVASVLVIAVVRSTRGSLRARLVWLGTLAYMAYNFAFYLFGLAFNDAFLAYAAIVALSSYALTLGIMGLDVPTLGAMFRAQTPVRGIAAYMLLVAAGLGGAWISQSLAFAVNGTVPTIIQKTGSPTSIVFALDLVIVVPAMAVGGVLLWKRHPWGFLLGSILMVKSVTYALALLGMSASQAHEHIKDAWGFAPFAALFLVGGLLGTLALLHNLRQPPLRRVR